MEWWRRIEAEHKRQKAMEVTGAHLLVGDAGRMLRRAFKGFLVLLVIVMAVGAAAPDKQRGAVAYGACHVHGSGGFVRPDDRCTPGTFDTLTRVQACRHKKRPFLSLRERRRISAQYGFRHWTGRNGELDHRVPFFLGGRTEEDNLWPEHGSIPNVKDRLEFRIHDMVCDWRIMSVTEAREVFLGDWTEAYRRYVR